MISFATTLAYAQSSDVPKVEVGALFTLNRLRDLSETDTGMGLRVGYNISNGIAVEGEFNYFPGGLTDFLRPAGLPNTVYSQNRTQGLFGVKYIPLRADKFGIGGKLRPGFVRFNGDGGGVVSATFGCVSGTPSASTPFICQIAAGKTNFAMDLGGVFEYYPARRIVTRFDLGATIIRFGPSLGNDGFNSTNLQMSAGIGFRF
jgi:Outer membrane protein beta-barrel domain